MAEGQCLFASPELDRLQDGGHGDLDLQLAIAKGGTELRNLSAIKEAVLVGQKERARQEILQ